MTGLEFAAPAVGKLIIGKVFETSVKRSQGFVDKVKNLNDKDKVIQKYLKACEKVRRVRTLSYSEKDAIFEEIYVPLNMTSSSNTNYLVDKNVRIPTPRAINIVGRAGQGKSTILRRLFLNTLESGQCIPFFLELKYFRENTLEKNLINELSKWGLKFDEPTIREFISSTDVHLYLDGFDEIPTQYVQTVFEQITEINNSFDCELIITSRPRTEICHTSNIDTFKVSDLNLAQIHAILDIVCRTKNQAYNLKQALDSKPHVLEFIKSPILAVLLQIVFAHSNTVPSSLNDFYNRVYLTLFHRHDELKTNVVRNFKTDLTCDESEKIFQAFCYFSLKNGDINFSKEIAIMHMSSALELRNFNDIKADDYFHDVFFVTNIIQEDGYDNYTFFHRSIQEFYAYKFIRDFLSSSQKANFLKLCVNDQNIRNQFSLVLNFLDDDRDSTSYIEHYYLPLYGYLLGADIGFNLDSAFERIIKEGHILIGSGVSKFDPLSNVSMVGFSDKLDCLNILESQLNNKKDEAENHIDGISISSMIHKSAFRDKDGKSRTMGLFKQYHDVQDIDAPYSSSSALLFPGEKYYDLIMESENKQECLQLFKEKIAQANLIEKYKQKQMGLADLKASASKLLDF